MKSSNEVIEKAQEQEEKPKQFYTWNCITYMEEANLQRLLKEQARNWAYASHDKDILEDGSPKKKHTHVVLTFDQRKSFKSICRLFDSYADGQNSRCQPCNDIGGSLEYLWHKNQQGKYQYDRNIVEYSSKQWFEKYLRGEEQTQTDNLIDDLIVPAKDFSVIGLARKYGRDFIKNVGKYVEFRKMALAEQSGINPLDYYYNTYTTEERDFIDNNASGVNDALKGALK